LLLFSAFPAILSLIVIGLFVFTVYMVLGGAGKRYVKLKNKVSPEFLNYSRLFLLRWDKKQALIDISSEIRRTTESSFFGGNWSHAEGTIRSLNDSDNKWLVFTLNLRNGKGKIDLHTSSRRFSLEYEDRLGTFRVDGKIFGFINSDNVLMTTDQLSIGRFHSIRTFTPMGLDLVTPIEIGGRKVAEVNYLTDFGDRLWKAPALADEMVADISNNEIIWIIAVIAVRLYSHCKTSKTV
jgi:hypothetical protein